MNKKTLLTILTFYTLSGQISFADSSEFHYIDLGGIYTNTVTPIDVAKTNADEKIDFTNLKSGQSISRNILYIAEVGDASIHAAAKRAGIKNIKYVDSKICKVFIPLGFIPILVKETKTIVYGE